MAQPILTVFVLPNCRGCERAYQVAGEVVRRCPAIQVQVIDLSQPGAIRPPTVFSVPTYLLNGRVISLGNPGVDQLLSIIMVRLGGPDGDDHDEAGLSLGGRDLPGPQSA